MSKHLLGTCSEQGLGVSTWGEYKLAEIWYSSDIVSGLLILVSRPLIKTLQNLATQSVVHIGITWELVTNTESLAPL